MDKKAVFISCIIQHLYNVSMTPFDRLKSVSIHHPTTFLSWTTPLLLSSPKLGFLLMEMSDWTHLSLNWNLVIQMILDTRNPFQTFQCPTFLPLARSQQITLPGLVLKSEYY